MNFTYNGADKGKIIKKYTKYDNTYFVEYLDGCVACYTSNDKEEELKLTNTMILQARDREEKMNITKRENLTNTFSLLSGTTLVSMVSLYANDKQSLAGVSALAFVASMVTAIHNAKTTYELKKYKLFLEMIREVPAKELETKWLEYLKVDKIYADRFDINHLDNHSYALVKSFYKSIKSEKK